MDIYPLFFLTIFVLGSFAALAKDPIWGLVTYVYVYFNIPGHQWWGYQLPDLRWSFLSAGVLLVSCFLHKDKLSSLALRENRPFKWLLTLLILMIAVAPFTPNPELSGAKVYDFFRYVLIFFLIGKIVRDFRKYKAFLGVLLFCIFYLTVLAHHYFRGQRLDGVGLPDGSDANMLAALMLLAIPLFLVMGITERGWQRWAALGALPFALNTFVMCGSRGAFLGLLVQGVLALWLLRKRIGLGKAIGCCAIVIIGLLLLMSDQYRDRLFGLKQGIEEESLAETSAGRWEIWQYGLEMAKDYPLGAGGGSFMAMSTVYLPDHLIEHNVGARASHNTYLMVLVEQGCLGFLLLVGFLWAQFRILTQARRAALLKPDAVDMAEQKKIIYHTYALQIALAGFWSAAFFIDRVYFEAIYLVVAITPVIQHIAHSASEGIQQGPVTNLAWGAA